MASLATDDNDSTAPPIRKDKKKKSRRNKNKKKDSTSANSMSPNKNKKLSFKERQELRQQQQKDKRQSKQRCYLCGKNGHTRKQCPGIEDGGRGESRYRAKGKGSKISKKKNRGEKKNKKRGGSFEVDEGELAQEEDIYNLKIFQSLIPFCDICTNINSLLTRTNKTTIIDACKIKVPNNLKLIISSLNKVSELKKQYIVGDKEESDTANTTTTTTTTTTDNNNNNNNEGNQKKTKLLYTSGIHPYYTDEFQFEHVKESLIDSFKRNDVVAIGPIGLDYSTRCTVEPSKQISYFTEQVKVAVKMNKPLLIHIRPELRYEEGHKKAIKDVATILSTECPADYKICLNAYAGTNETLFKLMKIFSNLYVSFSSIITFSKAKHIREVAFDIPNDRFLLCSDGPDLPCSQIAGIYSGRNVLSEPSHLPFIANGIFEQKKLNLTFDDVLTFAYNNTLTFFDLFHNTNENDNFFQKLETKKSEKKVVANDTTSLTNNEEFDIELELNDE